MTLAEIHDNFMLTTPLTPLIRTAHQRGFIFESLYTTFAACESGNTRISGTIALANRLKELTLDYQRVTLTEIEPPGASHANGAPRGVIYCPKCV